MAFTWLQILRVAWRLQGRPMQSEQGAAFAVWTRPHRATIFEGEPSTCRIQCPVLGWQVTGVHVPARSHPDAPWSEFKRSKVSGSFRQADAGAGCLSADCFQFGVTVLQALDQPQPLNSGQVPRCLKNPLGQVAVELHRARGVFQLKRDVLGYLIHRSDKRCERLGAVRVDGGQLHCRAVVRDVALSDDLS